MLHPSLPSPLQHWTSTQEVGQSRQEQLESTGARRDYFKLHHMQLSRSLSIRQGQLVSVRAHPPQLIQIINFN